MANNVEIVQQAIKRVLQLPSAEIPSDMDLGELGLDSLKILDLFLDLETSFGLFSMEEEIGFENFKSINAIMSSLGIEA